MTVKSRITLFVAAAGFTASLLFSVVVFFEMIEQPFRLLDNVLKEEAYRIAETIEAQQGRTEAAPPDSAAHELYPYWIEIREQSTDAMLYQSHLAELIRLSPVAPGSSAIVSVAPPPEQEKSQQNSRREMTFRVKTFRVPVETKIFVVQIARPMGKLEEEIKDLIFGIVSALIFSTLALIAISHVAAGKILQPIGAMKDLAQYISENNLGQRIPVSEAQDEFSELARTINRMLDRLQNSFVRQRNVLFDTSHELKTPLATMRLAIDGISASGMENIPSLTSENILRLRNQVLRMERLVKDLLNLSSLEALSSIDAEPVHITELLSSLAADYQFVADAHDIKMDVRLPEQLIVQGDAAKLHRAFSNIIDNALKYNVDGGRVEIIGRRLADDISITVANTGPGIAKEEIGKVFEQFYRVEKSRSLEHGGSGLGLAIVKRIIELHDGSVELQSEPGALTSVTVYLPRHPEIGQCAPIDR